MDKEINDINKNIKFIQHDINSINNKLDKLISSCDNMDKHINFIDSIYNNIKSPMEYIVNKVHTISGTHKSILLETKEE